MNKLYFAADKDCNSLGVISSMKMVHECLDVLYIPKNTTFNFDQPFVKSGSFAGKNLRIFIVDDFSCQRVSVVEFVHDETTHNGVDLAKELIRRFNEPLQGATK